MQINFNREIRYLFRAQVFFACGIQGGTTTALVPFIETSAVFFAFCSQHLNSSIEKDTNYAFLSFQRTGSLAESPEESSVIYHL